MTDQQTVREALRVSEKFRGENGYVGVRIKSDQELIDALGIDPDMPLETLKRRLLWGERVENYYTTFPGNDSLVAWSVLAWLTREEA